MSKAGERKGQRVYHAIVAILILLSGAGLLGVGMWLRFTDRGEFLDLDFSGSSNGAIEAISSTDVGAMVIGGFLILSGIISLIALSRKSCVGVTFRIIHIIFALVIFILLAGVCAASITFLAARNTSDVRNFFENAWENGVGDTNITSPNDVERAQAAICKIESTFKCRGFDDNDCVACPTGAIITEPGCLTQTASRCAFCATITGYERDSVDPSVGCYGDFVNTLSTAFLPSAIVSGILSIVVLIDIFFTCCL